MKYHGTNALVWQPDIRVSTFASGLVLVQRSAVGRATDNHRDALQVGDILPLTNTPAIDGLYIFPATQETRTASHTTYLVSAYGRSTDKPTYIVSERVISDIQFQSQRVVTKTKVIVSIGVISAGDLLFIPVAPTEPAGRTRLFFVDGILKNTVFYPSIWRPGNVDRTNYGAWDEYSTTYLTYPILLPIPIFV